MTPVPQGTIRLFRFAGIDVFLHWSWFIIAVYEIGERTHGSASLAWNALEYLALFLIVIVHEFGHALACRQVGGAANRIILWPLGGVAYVNPPPRPGATLWSIAAGPLVNVVLLPFLGLAWYAAAAQGWAKSMPDAYLFVEIVFGINVVLLAFNLLPIYPLDGGQILRSLLWFVLGRARSLMVVTVLGFVGIACILILAAWMQSIWFIVLAIFMLLNCWGGLRQAQVLARMEKGPRREGFACPSCKAAPPMGAFWVCRHCKTRFDTFQTLAVCPSCSAQFEVTHCSNCGGRFPIAAWVVSPAIQPIRT